jgi:signal peptidase I
MAFWNKKKTDEKVPKTKKPVWREWLDAGLFAVVAATLIRTFVFEAYTIPTGSMEGSMLVNDYLFVSKLSYGPRIPMTPIAVPLVHNTMPFTGGKSYYDGVQWKYHRLPGFGNVERYDVVVFNYPAGDTACAERPADDYYSILRDELGNDRDALKARYKVLSRPVDKAENYIKRCVALPGDKVELKDAVLFINDQPAPTFPHQKLWYTITPKGMSAVPDVVNDVDVEQMAMPTFRNVYFLENNQVAELRKSPDLFEVKPVIYPKGAYLEESVFPHDTSNFKFNRDNFGPIIIPKKGVTVQLTPQTIALYRRVIKNYEGNKLEEKDGKFFINDKEVASYTFNMDYYWMMGDNRDNSADSRYWGYVPVDHVVGKAWFVWFSYHKEGISHGIRWRRLFHTVHSLEK